MHKKKTKNKIPKAFSVAMLFSVLFWLLIKMSKEYSTVISFPLEYVHIPEDKIIQQAPTSQLEVQVVASGFRLFVMNINPTKIKLDARKLKRKSAVDHYFLMQQQKMDIQSQITKKIKVEQLVLDTIYLNLGTLASKKVPVVGKFDISYKLGYHLIGKIKVTPDSILVTGPKEQLDTLQGVQLENFTKNNISETLRTTLQIKELPNSIKLSVRKAAVFGEVDRFTEGVIQVPFQIINLPDSISVNTFPTDVKVVFQVGLNAFKGVKASSFKIVCDYQYSLENKLNYFIPKVVFKPEVVTSVKIMPAKVEFLTKRQ